MNMRTRARVELPATNELAAVMIGCDMTDSNVNMKDKAALKKLMASFEKVEVVYKQNTADELNIVVPDFPEFDRALQEMHLPEEQLESIVGGEGGLVVLGTILTLIGSLGASTAAIFGVTVGGTASVVVGAAVLTIGAVGIAGAVTAVGLGVAAGVGVQFGSSNEVNVGLAS